MLGIVAWLQVLVQETLAGEPHLSRSRVRSRRGLVMTRSSMNFDDSTARSSHANTHTVATPSNTRSEGPQDGCSGGRLILAGRIGPGSAF
jgi:hypothetical protein